MKCISNKMDQKLKYAEKMIKLTERIEWPVWIEDLIESISVANREQNTEALTFYAFIALNELTNFVMADKIKK